MRPIVSLDNVSLRYHSVSGETPAVSHLNLEVLPGEFICIVGPSGFHSFHAGRASLPLRRKYPD